VGVVTHSDRVGSVLLLGHYRPGGGSGASFQAEGRRMLRLIKADLASTRKPHLRNGTPSLFLNFRARSALLGEGSHFGFQIVAHEIEFVDATLIGWVDCGFSRRQGEDQPAVTRLHGI